jgi:hypothetical protein
MKRLIVIVLACVLGLFSLTGCNFGELFGGGYGYDDSFPVMNQEGYIFNQTNPCHWTWGGCY